MEPPKTVRVTKYEWPAGTTKTPGVLLDIPGVRSRGTFIPLAQLATVIDQLEDIENSQ